jgi:hypothetical protein
MSFNYFAKGNDDSIKLLRGAYERLVSDGMTSEEAETRVKRNFERVNNDPNAKLSEEELCKKT